MALKNMSLLAGATIAASSGTALVFADDSQTIQNGVHLVVPADADYQTRRQVTAKVRQPVLDPKTGRFSKDKKSISYTVPLVLADGSVVFNVIRMEREIHPATMAAVALDMNHVGAQLLTSTASADFWAIGSCS